MKRGLVLIGAVTIAVAVYFIFFFKTGDKPAEEKQAPLAQSANSESFNKPFNDLLNGYFDLKTALVNWDSTKASVSAKNLAGLAAKVPYDSLKADSTIILTAKTYSDTIAAQAKALESDPTLVAKRHSFNNLTDNFYNLIRTVHYDQQIIYHDKCPMAFGPNTDGFWLSNSRDIVNPYLGNKHPKYHSGMVSCGDIEDSINYVK
jgi:hypothetical protein